MTNLVVDRGDAIKKISQHIPNLVTQEKNEILLRLISQEDVDQAMKEMALGKSPRQDGFTTEFFHHFWSLVREEVWKLVEDSRTSQDVLLALNATFISLTPKEEKETSP